MCSETDFTQIYPSRRQGGIGFGKWGKGHLDSEELNDSEAPSHLLFPCYAAFVAIYAHFQE